MPLDTTHQHVSSSIMKVTDPNTPINPDGGGGIPNPFTEDVDAGGFRLTNLDAAVDDNDAVRQAEVNALIGSLNLSLVLALGNDANAGPIVNLADPTDPQDAATKAYADSVAGGALLSATVDLDAADIATLSSVPVQVVAAPGAGKVIVAVDPGFQFKAGTVPFGVAAGVRLTLGSTALFGLGVDVQVPFQGSDDYVGFLRSLGPVVPQADCENQPLRVDATNDPEAAGSILTSTLGEGGADYAEDDEFTLTPAGGGTDAIGVVDTVDGGAILTYHLTGPGTGFLPGTASVTATTGIGTGGEIEVDTITPLSDGTARLTVLYYVMDLLV